MFKKEGDISIMVIGADSGVMGYGRRSPELSNAQDTISITVQPLQETPLKLLLTYLQVRFALKSHTPVGRRVNHCDYVVWRNIKLTPSLV